MNKKVIISIILFVAVVVYIIAMTNQPEINNEVITEEMTSNNNEIVFPEGFVDEGLEFDYNLVIMEELNVE